MSIKKLNKSISREFILILIFHVLFTILVICPRIQSSILIFRQVIGFIYITIIPGLLILRTLRIYNLNTAETFVYSIGLSLFFLMLVGFIINILCIFLKISYPISEKLTYVVIIIITILIIISYKLYYCYSNSNTQSLELGNLLCHINYILALTLLPFISIFGSYMLNYFNSNLILLIFFVVLSLIPALVTICEIPEETYWWCILMISVSLLLFCPLSTNYITRGDSDIEYSVVREVILNKTWNPLEHHQYYSLLRLTILHPIYTILLDINLKYVFKIVHPLLYSFTPLAIFIAFKRQTNSKIAFLASCLFMFIFPFYVLLSRNTRTGVAELFLSLFILALTEENIQHSKKKVLIIIFLTSMIMSHYGVSYVFMFILIIAIVVKYIIKCINNSISNSSIISVNFAITYIIFILAWYIYTSGSITYSLFIDFTTHVINSIKELSNPKGSYSIYVATRGWPFSIMVSIYMTAILLIFILAGIIICLWNLIRGKKTQNVCAEFVIFSLASFCIIILTFLPTKAFNPARLFHVTLCFLSLNAVIGFIGLIEIFKKVIRKFINIRLHSKRCSSILKDPKKELKLFSLFLLLFLLFSSGFISEVITRDNDYSPNTLICKPRAQNINDPTFILNFYGREIITDYEFCSSGWLIKKRSNNIKIFSDPTWKPVFAQHLPFGKLNHLAKSFATNISKAKFESGYIFLRSFNILKQIVLVRTYPPTIETYTCVFPVNQSAKIYTNGYSEIYYHYLIQRVSK